MKSRDKQARESPDPFLCDWRQRFILPESMYYQCLITLDLEGEVSATLHLPRVPVIGDRIELGHVFDAHADAVLTVVKVFLFPSNHPAAQHGTAAWVVVKQLLETLNT